MRILIILALFLVLYYMLRGLLQPRRGEKNTRTRRAYSDVGRGSDSELVKDPHCQTFIPINAAFRAEMGGKDLFFCSEECMHRYIREKKDRSSEAV